MQPEGREEGRAAAEARGQHTQQTFYLEARGLGACHPHLLAGRKEHLQDGGRRGGAVLPRAVGAPGSRADARAGRRRHHDPSTHTYTHTSRPAEPPQRASRVHSDKLVFSPPTPNHRTPNNASIRKDKKAELKADPGIASPSPPGLLSNCFQQLCDSETRLVLKASLF